MPWAFLGQAYAIVGDYAHAEHCFATFISLAPASEEGYADMGMLEELKGEPSNALPYLEKALSINPKSQKAQLHLENVRHQLK